MLELYQRRWRGLRRWWRRTPTADKVFVPVVFLGLMLLPFEISSLLSEVGDSGDANPSTRRPAPTNFGPITAPAQQLEGTMDE